MIETHSQESLNVLHTLFGDWFLLLALVFIFGSVNFMFVWVKGIQYLDREFSPDKQYDDTWTYAAGSRFFDYCWWFLRGKIKTKRVGMCVWMCLNSASYIVVSFWLLYAIFFDIYKWIISFGYTKRLCMNAMHSFFTLCCNVVGLWKFIYNA